MHIHDHVVPAFGVEQFDRFVDAIRTGGMVGPGHHGNPTSLLNRIDNGFFVGCHHNRADASLHGTPPDMDDHGFAANIGQRLAGKAGGGHAGRDQDDGVRHRNGAFGASRVFSRG